MTKKHTKGHRPVGLMAKHPKRAESEVQQCYLAWTQYPTGYTAPTLNPDIPFDGGGGGEGNVQTGPRGSIATKPMVPAK